MAPAATKSKAPLIICICVVVALILGVGAFFIVKNMNTDQQANSGQAEQTADEEELPAEWVTKYVVNEGGAVFYADADASAQQLETIAYAAPVSFMETSKNGFCRVFHQGQEGYMLATDLSDEEPAVEEASTSVSGDEPVATTSGYETMYVVHCDEWISLRKSPSTTADRYCTIPLGASVQRNTSYDEENGFYRVSYGGYEGYALAEYLSYSPTSYNSSSSATRTTYMYVVNCDEWISLRKEPSTSADRYCTIPLGAKVEYISGASNGFMKVAYDGYTGYALASYLSF